VLRSCVSLFERLRSLSYKMHTLKQLGRQHIVFESNHLLVVNKPVGVLSQDGSKVGSNLIDLSKDYIKSKFNKQGNVYVAPLHRLDRVASGLVCLGLSSKAAARVSKSFQERHVRKEYLAIVSGLLDREGKIDGGSSYSEYWTNRGGKFVSERAGNDREQVDGDLQWRLINHPIDMKGGQTTSYSFIAIRTSTGRKHQIRRQLASIGHPILGDVLYGSGRRFGDASLSHGAPGPIMLHASQLIIPNPVRPEPGKGGKAKTSRASSSRFLKFQCPPPKEWRLSLSSLTVPDLRKGQTYFDMAGGEEEDKDEETKLLRQIL